LYVRFSFTTGASQEATQAASTTWDLRFISRDAKRDESKLAGKKLAPHALDLPSKVPDVQAQRQSEQRHLITSKVSGSNRRSSVLPPFQLCVDEVPHAVLDGKLEQRMHSLHRDIKPATIARVQELLAHVLTELKAASCAIRWKLSHLIVGSFHGSLQALAENGPQLVLLPNGYPM